MELEQNAIIKKLQFKDRGQQVLILNSPLEFEGIIKSFSGEVHKEVKNDHEYEFIQVFATTNEELKSLALKAEHVLKEDGLFWLCYPKKTSKTYKGSNCSRETVGAALAEIGYEPVRQVAIDEDWSALRFRKVENIKKMIRKFAVTEQGKQRIDE
ncbi:DUF3052 domain-containing protein [Metabacillus litoralis]|uniref:DUF3052 domain-containing protein n=1 Tax=Metabacillus litoralis TaxID=152268 RepID=A0A5C6W4Z4_9BACI|nr:DUF3052 domain-containing protein [Metabacillus litoralis]TXC93027.1 DUF3052 domain-containing protein [Metabacillus litoralis]